jgi:hypothetical protein
MVDYEKISELLSAAKKIISLPENCILNGKLIEASTGEGKIIVCNDPSAIHFTPASALYSVPGYIEDDVLEAYCLLDDACQQTYSTELKNMKDHRLVLSAFNKAMKTAKSLGNKL